jgi:hypothetical protein
VIFWGLGMRHDHAEPARSEAANTWAFAAWAHKARGAAVDAFSRRPGIRQPANQNAHGPRYGAAALVYLIVVILDIAPVQDVIPSHYVPDDEDCTGQYSQRKSKKDSDGRGRQLRAALYFLGLGLVNKHYRRSLFDVRAEQDGIPIRQPDAPVGFGFADSGGIGRAVETISLRR